MAEAWLEGITVLDLSQGIAGAYCTKLLAGLGARVIKVEPPQGDPTRRVGPFAGGVPHGERSVLFLYLNTSKEGVTLDITSITGRKLLRELVQRADVLVESFVPGLLDDLGLGYADLARITPGLVVASITPYGQTGPYRRYRAEEINLYAASGLMYLTGEPDREPLQEGAALSQYGAGQSAFAAVLAALWHREVSGQGQHVDISVAEHNISILENAVTAFTYAGYATTRTGNRGYGRAAWGIYPCRDGYVGVVAAPDHRWPQMAEMMGREELKDPRFGSRKGRTDHADEIDALMLPWLLEHDKLEIFHEGQRRGLAFAYVAAPQDLLASEQLEARAYFVDIEHPAAGQFRYPGPPFRSEGLAWRFQRAPLLGEHNAAVYCGDLGYSRQDLVRLRQLGVV